MLAIGQNSNVKNYHNDFNREVKKIVLITSKVLKNKVIESCPYIEPTIEDAEVVLGTKEILESSIFLRGGGAKIIKSMVSVECTLPELYLTGK